MDPGLFLREPNETAERMECHFLYLRMF